MELRWGGDGCGPGFGKSPVDDILPTLATAWAWEVSQQEESSVTHVQGQGGLPGDEGTHVEVRAGGQERSVVGLSPCVCFVSESFFEVYCP